MKNKKFFLIGIIAVVVLVITGFITHYIDSARVTTNHEPKFCIKTINNDGSKVTYWGLGYKTIRYVGISPNEPYENNIGVKMGSWFMKYELPIDNDKNIKNEISNLDEFYNTEITKNFDIRTLGIDYNIFDAQKDNCFVVGAMVHNDYLYSEFRNDVKNKKTSFIRVAQNTKEGDLVLIDILYYDKSDKFYAVIDSSRNQYIKEEERKIELKEFMNMGEYHFDNHLYWVLYNDNVNDDNFNTEEVFKIVTIN